MRINGRLGEIKFNFNNITDDTLYIPYEDVKFLIKQAERVHELEQQNKRYKQALEYIQKETRKAIYTPRKQKCNSDFEREFERGKTRGLIRASDIVKEAIEVLEGEKEMNEFCPTCNGSGGIEVLDYSIGEVVTIPCSDCRGSGEMEGEE